jgi:hypothetical protein
MWEDECALIFNQMVVELNCECHVLSTVVLTFTLKLSLNYLLMWSIN